MSELLNITAYVDSSGNHDLNIAAEGASNLYVCAAVIVKDDDISEATSAVIRLQKAFFSGSELKSSGVGGDNARRLKILKAIDTIPFGYHALIVDKAQLDRDSGLKFKTSFFKLLNRMFYELLLRGTRYLTIVADQHGSTSFMESFERYLKNKVLPTLFSEWTHRFDDSKKSPLLQLADIIAGSLSWCYDNEKNCNEYREAFLSALYGKQLGTECWPKRSYPLKETPPASSEEWDQLINKICENAVISFIDKYSESVDANRQMQVAILRHMLFFSEQEPSDAKAIYSDNLIKHLQRQGFEIKSKRKFGHSVIGPLRDEGVVIAGDSKGYRLATSTKDVDRYITHDRSILEPMLGRLIQAQSLLKTGTANCFDMLDREEYTVIKELARTFSQIRLKYSIAAPSEDLEEGF